MIGILVLQSDKISSTVLMYKTEYIEYMYDMLSGDTIYKKIDIDQSQANKLINKLRSNIFDESTIVKIKKCNLVDLKLYGKLETHKSTLSMRPVVSSIGTPSHKKSVFVQSILSSVLSRITCNVKNSYEFVTFIRLDSGRLYFSVIRRCFYIYQYLKKSYHSYHK